MALIEIVVFVMYPSFFAIQTLYCNRPQDQCQVTIGIDNENYGILREFQSYVASKKEVVIELNGLPTIFWLPPVAIRLNQYILISPN